MKNLIFILLLVSLAFSCRKRDSNYAFAGVWKIQKVEQVKYNSSQQTLDSVIEGDTIGWFALFNGIVGYSKAETTINFASFSGLRTDNDGTWVIDEHEGDRLIINGIIYKRDRIVGGEKWTWIGSPDVGVTYTRETIYVKKK